MDHIFLNKTTNKQHLNVNSSLDDKFHIILNNKQHLTTSKLFFVIYIVKLRNKCIFICTQVPGGEEYNWGIGQCLCTLRVLQTSAIHIHNVELLPTLEKLLGMGSTFKHALGTIQRILEQHCNGHWSHTSRNWSYTSSYLTGFLKINISHKSISRLFTRVIYGICPHINNGGTRFNPAALYLKAKVT